MRILITGGAGFIGSALIRYIIANTADTVINVDKLTYAGSKVSLASIESNDRYFFEQVDICCREAIEGIFQRYQPHALIHLAAESHVDRSIASPDAFIQTNINGTYVLLEVARTYWKSLSASDQKNWRFQQVSTDEVYGDLHAINGFFTEKTAYAPSSPYSASKASADHLVRAWYRTFGLPVIVTNCSNNYGPYQFPEKLIPLMIRKALAGEFLPLYGSGYQVRDWLYVEDHVEALYLILQKGKIGESYNIGGHNEKKNIEVVETICHLLEELAPEKPLGIKNYRDLITHVEDRQGHDLRYAIDASKIKKELAWCPRESFESGMRKTVDWYVNNTAWWK